MTRWRWAVVGAMLAGWWWVGDKINYPPTEAQLLLGLWPVWLTRLLCFWLVIAAFWFWKKVFDRYRQGRLYFYFVLIMCVSPTLFGWFWLQPMESLKWFLFSGLLWLSTYIKRGGWILPVIFLGLFSFWQNSGKAKIWENLEPGRATFEVMQKFGREDSLIEKIELPLWWRRLSYNKYAWMMSETFKEVISFWDMEVWFFQEIHPLGQKGLIMFYWPEFVVAIVGLYALVRKKDEQRTKLLIKLGAWAYVDYLLTKSGGLFRDSLMLPPLALLIAIGWEFLTQFKVYLGILLALGLYAVETFVFDLSHRPDYWLDNRPLVYQYLFETVADIPGNIQVTDRVANAKLYCRYFLKQKCDSRFTMAGFNFRDSPARRSTTYAGFEGEFVGPEFQNVFPGDINKRLADNGFEVIAVKPVRDNIANQYGFNLVIAKTE